MYGHVTTASWPFHTIHVEYRVPRPAAVAGTVSVYSPPSCSGCHYPRGTGEPHLFSLDYWPLRGNETLGSSRSPRDVDMHEWVIDGRGCHLI